MGHRDAPWRGGERRRGRRQSCRADGDGRDQQTAPAPPRRASRTRRASLCTSSWPAIRTRRACSSACPYTPSAPWRAAGPCTSSWPAIRTRRACSSALPLHAFSALASCWAAVSGFGLDFDGVVTPTEPAGGARFPPAVNEELAAEPNDGSRRCGRPGMLHQSTRVPRPAPGTRRPRERRRDPPSTSVSCPTSRRCGEEEDIRAGRRHRRDRPFPERRFSRRRRSRPSEIMPTAPACHSYTSGALFTSLACSLSAVVKMMYSPFSLIALFQSSMSASAPSSVPGSGAIDAPLAFAFRSRRPEPGRGLRDPRQFAASGSRNGRRPAHCAFACSCLPPVSAGAGEHEIAPVGRGLRVPGLSMLTSVCRPGNRTFTGSCATNLVLA